MRREALNFARGSSKREEETEEDKDEGGDLYRCLIRAPLRGTPQ